MNEKYGLIMSAELKVDVYSGESCDEHKPYWDGHHVGDMEGGYIENPLQLDLKQFPPGTVVRILVPICPNEECQIPRETDSPECISCGFDWRNWDDEQYS